MAIKRVTYNTLSYLVAEIKDRYAEKSAIGALGGLDKVAVENLADDLKNLINGKANAATTLAGYGITDGMTATEIASAISTAIAGTDHLSRVMVDSTADIDVAADGAEKKIYMVKNTDGEAGNLYSEYMVIDGKLEKVGDWKVDLSSYAKTAEVTAAIANALTAYAKTADVTKAINAAVAGLIQLDDLSVASTGAGNVVTGLAYDNKTGKFTVTKGLTALTEADFTEMRWFSLASLKALVSEITARENSNMQAVNDTFSEVYDNMETLDGRIDALEHKTDAAYLGNCYCGSVYLGYVSETDT